MRSDPTASLPFGQQHRTYHEGVERVDQRQRITVSRQDQGQDQDQGHDEDQDKDQGQDASMGLGKEGARCQPETVCASLPLCLCGRPVCGRTCPMCRVRCTTAG